MNGEYYYVAIDGDSIGKRLERYIVNDNLDELSPFSQQVLDYVQKIKTLVEQNPGRVYMAGGDNLLARVNDLNKFLKEFKDSTKDFEVDFSVGIGRKVVLAYLALKVAKTSAISGKIVVGEYGKDGVHFTKNNGLQ